MLQGQSTEPTDGISRLISEDSAIILVVHADSYTGHYIARTLVMDPSLHIRITARRRESVLDLEHLGCEYYPLRDVPPEPEDLNPIYKGISTVVLIPPMVPNLDDIVARHIDALNRSGPSPNGRPINMVFMPCVRGDRGYPTADPWACLDRAEDMVRRGSSDIGSEPPNKQSNIIFRIGYVQQNLVPLAELIRARAVLPLPIGANGRVVPVNLKDVASAVRSVIPGGRRFDQAPGNTYSLTGPCLVSGHDIAKIASLELGFEIVYINVRDAVMRQILRTLPGITDTEIEAYMAMYQDIRDGFHSKISNDLDDLLPRPSITLAEFFHENASQFRPDLTLLPYPMVDPIAIESELLGGESENDKTKD